MGRASMMKLFGEQQQRTALAFRPSRPHFWRSTANVRIERLSGDCDRVSTDVAPTNPPSSVAYENSKPATRLFNHARAEVNRRSDGIKALPSNHRKTVGAQIFLPSSVHRPSSASCTAAVRADAEGQKAKIRCAAVGSGHRAPRKVVEQSQ